MARGALLLVVLVLVSGAHSSTTWQDHVCNLSKKVCIVCPQNPGTQRALASFLSARSPVVRSGYTVLISPLNETCDGIWEVQSSAPHGSDLFVWSTPPLIVPYSNITVTSLYADTPVNILIDEETARTRQAGDPACSFAVFTGSRLRVSNLAIAVNDSCAAWLQDAPTPDDLAAIVLKSADASDSVFSNISCTGASTVLAVHPPTRGSAAINVDGLTIHGVEVPSYYAGTWDLPVVLAISNFEGAVAVMAPDLAVVSDAPYYLGRASIDGNFLNWNWSAMIGVDYHCEARSCASESCTARKFCVAAIALLAVFIALIVIYACVEYGERRLGDARKQAGDGAKDPAGAIATKARDSLVSGSGRR